MTKWKKVAVVIKGASKAPKYLEVYEGERVTSFRVNYRKRVQGRKIELRLKLEPPDPPGSFKDWKEAQAAADDLIHEAKHGKKPAPKPEVQQMIEQDQKDLIRSEQVIQQLLEESKTNDRPKTQAEKALTWSHHIPWLNERAPFPRDLTVATWPALKAHLRKTLPGRALENHAKRYRMFEIRCHDLGLTPKRLKIKFNAKKEDNREEGLLVPDADFEKMLAAATPKHFGKIKRIMPAWRDRMIFQRRTGLRPGEVREMKKDQAKVFFKDGAEIASIHIPASGNKNAKPRTFLVRDPAVLELLKRRLDRVEGPYLFPARNRHKRKDGTYREGPAPMDKHLDGWKRILKRAGVNPDYTPHDLRHTYATEMFQRTKNYAALCYQLDMSMDTAQKVYLHLKVDDTAAIAELAADIEPDPEDWGR